MCAIESVAAVVLAGGAGRRLGATINKVYLPLAGRPVIAWSLEAFCAASDVSDVIMIIRETDRALAREVIAQVDAPIELVVGGEHRHASEVQALAHLKPRINSGKIELIAIHDGSRPLVTTSLIQSVITEALHYGAAVPGHELDDVVKRDGDSMVPISGAGQLVRVQTPQVFMAAPLLEAYQRAAKDGFVGTDTAGCFERYAGVPIRYVPGDPTNIKITYGKDFPIAEALLAEKLSLQHRSRRIQAQ